MGIDATGFPLDAERSSDSPSSTRTVDPRLLELPLVSNLDSFLDEKETL